MDKRLRETAVYNYKINKVSSWVLGIFLAIILAGVAALGVFSPFLAFIAILLIGLPAAFGAISTNLFAKATKEITFSRQLKTSYSFFSPNNIYSFKILSSSLFSLLVYFIAAAASGLLIAIIFSIIKPDASKEIIQCLYDYFSSIDERTMEEVFGEYYNHVVIYELLTNSIGSLFATLFFLYRTSINSLFIYAKGVFKQIDGSFIRLVQNNVFKKHGRKIRKDYFSLNWVMFVLFFIFSVSGGFIVAYFLSKNSDVVSALGIATGFVSLMFFFPFYFGNMEALFAKYFVDYQHSTAETAEMMYASMRLKEQLNEEEMKKIEDAIKSLKEASSDNDDEEKK